MASVHVLLVHVRYLGTWRGWGVGAFRRAGVAQELVAQVVQVGGSVVVFRWYGYAAK